MPTKVVLFFGIAGVKLDECAQKIAQRHFGVTSVQKLQEHFPYSFISLDEEIKKSNPKKDVDIQHFLGGTYNLTRKRKIWEEAAAIVKKKIGQCDTDFCFVTIHLVYYYLNHYFSFINTNFIKEINPWVCFSLIDDIYAIEKRINEDMLNKEVYNLSYSWEAILSWRTAEMMTADILINSCGANGILNYFISTKQHIRTLLDIIKNPKCFKIYLSFPITDTRYSEDLRKYIDEVRVFLHENFVCFDPLGIDEIRFVIEDGTVKFIPRWPFGYGESIYDDNKDKDVESPNGNINYYEKLIRIISDHIIIRDYRYIDQSDCMVICRGLSAREKVGKVGFSSGVDKELAYAIATEKEAVLLDDNIIDKNKHIGVFDRINAHYNDFQQLKNDFEGKIRE